MVDIQSVRSWTGDHLLTLSVTVRDEHDSMAHVAYQLASTSQVDLAYILK